MDSIVVSDGTHSDVSGVEPPSVVGQTVIQLLLSIIRAAIRRPALIRITRLVFRYHMNVPPLADGDTVWWLVMKITTGAHLYYTSD